MAPLRAEDLDTRARRASLAVALASFAYLAGFLLRFGEVFDTGSDVVNNTAYGHTLFDHVYRAGWSAPKPVEMLLFGLLYRVSGSLWVVNMLFVVATALLIYYGCRIIGRTDGTFAPCLVFAALVAMMPLSFSVAVHGGSGLPNTLFAFMGLAYASDLNRLRDRIVMVVCLSAASLARPENWVSACLIILCVLGLTLQRPYRYSLRRHDLLLVIPLIMPVVWHLIDYGVFGNFFYSKWLAHRYAIEYETSHHGSEWFRYPALVKDAFYETLHVPSWRSVRAVVLVVLALMGARAIFMRQRRMLLFLACLFCGTIAFYFVVYLSGLLIFPRFFYCAYIVVLILVAVGVGQIASVAPEMLGGRWRSAVRVAMVGAVVAFLLGPFGSELLAERIPELRNVAEDVAQQSKAVNALVHHARSDSRPVILSTLSIAPARIALALHTGRDIYLAERVVGVERLGVTDHLPLLEGRAIYLAYGDGEDSSVAALLASIEKKAKRIEILLDEGGVRVRKCVY
jgi:hypothetical protein